MAIVFLCHANAFIVNFCVWNFVSLSTNLILLVEHWSWITNALKHHLAFTPQKNHRCHISLNFYAFQLTFAWILCNWLWLNVLQDLIDRILSLVSDERGTGFSPLSWFERYLFIAFFYIFLIVHLNLLYAQFLNLWIK